jgi:HD-GYP domain-containing protein (c-di-GMP phosphodiesterase class II)
MVTTSFGINGIRKVFETSNGGYALRISTCDRPARSVDLLDFGAHRPLCFVTNAHTFGGCVVEGSAPFVGEHLIEKIELLPRPFDASLRQRIERGYPPGAVFYNLMHGSLAELNAVIDLLNSSRSVNVPVLVFGPQDCRGRIRRHPALDFFTTVSREALQRKYLVLQDQWLRHSFSLRNCVRSELTLLFALQEKDGYTALHSQNVSLVAFLIGERMGRSPLELELLKMGGTLHDLGKLGILDSILNKAGKLTDEERTLVQQHPLKGAGIVSPIIEDLGPSMRAALLQMIKYHHRRFDGGGYPNIEEGLPSLSLLAHIIAMADAFDAMTTRRVYVAGDFTLEEKVEDVRQNRGRQFHPDVADALLAVLSDGISVETQIEPPSSRVIVE